MCRSKLKQDRRTRGNLNRTNNISSEDAADVSKSENPGDEYSLYHVWSSRTPIMVTLKLNGASTSMELDTGAGISVMSKQTYDQLWPKSK